MPRETDIEPASILLQGGTGLQILRVARAVSAAMDSALGGRGQRPVSSGSVMTLSRYLILVALERTPGASGTALAHILQVSPQTMSTVLAGLERERLIRRTHVAGSGRMLHAALTGKGRMALTRARTAVAEVEVGIDDGLRDHEGGPGLADLLECVYQAAAVG